MKLYISGPMSGKPAFNIPTFDAEAKKLRGLGHEVISPGELDDPAFRDLCLLCTNGEMEELKDYCYAAQITPDSWGDLLARDVKLLADDGIEGIVVLDGWGKSRGATLETYVGRLCCLPIYRLVGDTLEPICEDLLYEVHGRATGQPQHHYTPDLGVFPPLTDRNHEGLWDRPDTAKWHGSVAKGEIRTVDPTTGGEKGVKAEAYNLLPWTALDEVARLYDFGSKKYAPNNWRKGFAWSKCFASLIRHAIAFWTGEATDAETGCHHLASVVFHALTLMEFQTIHPGGDDRALR